MPRNPHKARRTGTGRVINSDTVRQTKLLSFPSLDAPAHPHQPQHTCGDIAWCRLAPWECELLN